MSLFTDLQNAGLPVVSATDGVSATFSRTLTDDEKETYLDILLPNRAIDRNRQNTAKPYAKNIPNWSKWSQQDLLNWWNANLADSIVDGFAIPAGVKTMLKAQNATILRLGQMEIAIRDYIWSDLPD